MALFCGFEYRFSLGVGLLLACVVVFRKLLVMWDIQTVVCGVSSTHQVALVLCGITGWRYILCYLVLIRHLWLVG